MRRHHPYAGPFSPFVDIIDQLIYPSSPGPSLPAYLADQNAPPRNQRYGHGLGAPTEFIPQPVPMVRQPLAPEEFFMPPADHTGVASALTRPSAATLADAGNADEPMHGFAPPDSDPSLNNGVGPLAEGFYRYNDAGLPSGLELRARMLDARIRGGHEDMSTNQAALRRTMAIQRMQQQATMAPMTQDGVRPSPLGPNTVPEVLRRLVQASNAYADTHPNRPHAGYHRRGGH